MLDSILKSFTYFIFIFIDSYIYLRIFFREKILNKPLIDYSNFKKYFIAINSENHSVWEIGNLNWANDSGKGFVKLAIDSNQIEAKFMYVSNIKSKKYQLTDTNRFIIKHNQPI